MSNDEPTFIGSVASVTGGIVRVRLRNDMPTTLVMVQGESYRIGQVGAFVRIPLGYTALYAICTQVGADAAPASVQLDSLNGTISPDYGGYRWMTVVLFGEAVGGVFERGVGQYPTVGDEVHLVTGDDLAIIYGAEAAEGTISIGTIAGSSGIPAQVRLGGLVTRHSALVGSTGSGKSNLVAVILEAIATGNLPSARVVLLDPHGEYSTALGDRARTFKLNPDPSNPNEDDLWVPFWALPFNELQEIILGGTQPNVETAIRDIVLRQKRQAAEKLNRAPPLEALTADSPVPFSIKGLWFELDDFEKRTFQKSGEAQTQDTLNALDEKGDPEALRSNRYPPASSYNTAPYQNHRRRNIGRQLELMQSRLRDSRFNFLFNPGPYSPDSAGNVKQDLDSLVAAWVGHDRPVTVLDVSSVPAEILPTIAGTTMRVIYDTLLWARHLPIGGRQQPLLVVLEEAHRFIPARQGGGSEDDTAAHRTFATIAKEGRKYGVGMMLVTQRPTEIDTTVLSQCGTIIALRLSNSADRSRVSAALPDDLGSLIELLPALRTGEGLLVGDAVFVPSRVRIRRAMHKPIGNDPELPQAWQSPRPDVALYSDALANWRSQTLQEPQAKPENPGAQ